MKLRKISDFNKHILHISVELDALYENDVGIIFTECPFPQCKIMAVGHNRFFTPNSSMPRNFKLSGDQLFKPDDPDWRTFWVPLEPTDDWYVIIQKADELSRLSGDRHHVRLESFSVADDILVPNFGS